VLMGHYDDAYDYEYEQRRIGRKIILLAQLQEFRDFRLYKPDRPRMWSWQGKVDDLYNEILREIKSELYDLRNVAVDDVLEKE
jgi:hypothetical protein